MEKTFVVANIDFDLSLVILLTFSTIAFAIMFGILVLYTIGFF